MKNDSEYLSINLTISCTKPTFTEDALVLKQTSLFRNKFFALVYKGATQSRRKKHNLQLSIMHSILVIPSDARQIYVFVRLLKFCIYFTQNGFVASKMNMVANGRFTARSWNILGISIN